MANYHSKAAAHDTLACTKTEAMRIFRILELADLQDQAHGFCFDFWPDDEKVSEEIGQGFLYADEFGDPDHLPQEAREKIGELLQKLNMPHLQVGVANTCDKMRINSFGGYYFRIMPDGRMVSPQIHWPDELGELAPNPLETERYERV